VHASKPTWESSGEGSKTKGASNILDAMIDITGFNTEETRSNQDEEQTKLEDKRKRNKLLRHECKAHMLVGKRNGL
jgi:hypothetical protein